MIGGEDLQAQDKYMPNIYMTKDVDFLQNASIKWSIGHPCGSDRGCIYIYIYIWVQILI